MPYEDDPDLWQPDFGAPTRAGALLGQAPVKQALLEQRRLDLQAITNLLTRAANDLRASDRRAVEAEARARAAEARIAEVEALAAAANERERALQAKASRAFETMKERIAQSEAAAAEAKTHARAMEERSDNALLEIDQRTSAIEKAAEERSFELETRLQAAEMRIEAARRALGDDFVVNETSNAVARTGEANGTASVAAPASQREDIVAIRVRH